MIDELMTKIFGKNWRTSFWSLVSGICAFLAFYPGALEPLPDYWENLARQAVAFAMGAGLFKMGLSSRDRVVSEKDKKELTEKIENSSDAAEIVMRKEIRISSDNSSAEMTDKINKHNLKDEKF